MLPNFDKLKGAKCAREGCLSVAGYVPVLRLYAPKSVPNSGKPAEMAFALPLCGSCAQDTRVENLINEADWHLLETTFARAGKVAPDKSRTEITWLPLFEVTLPATVPPFQNGN